MSNLKPKDPVEGSTNVTTSTKTPANAKSLFMVDVVATTIISSLWRLVNKGALPQEKKEVSKFSSYVVAPKRTH